MLLHTPWGPSYILGIELKKNPHLQLYVNAAHKETSALLRNTQNIVRRKHHVELHVLLK